MFAIPKMIIIFLALIISVSAYTIPSTVPRSVRELVHTVHQFHASVDVQLDAAQQRLKLLNRELVRQKERRRLLMASLRSSLLSADLRLDESKNACNLVRNYNRSTMECNRLPMVEETVSNLSKTCNAAEDPGSCFADKLVGYRVLKIIFMLRCKEVTKQKMTIKATMMVCAELQKRFENRMRVNTSQNPVVMELKGVLIGMDILLREIKMVMETIETFTPPDVTAEPEVSPYFVDI